MKGEVFVDAIRHSSIHYSEPETIESFLERPSWQKDAACRELDIHLFFPEKSGSYPNAVAAQVKAICAGCPVRVQCLEYSLQRHEYGFWAGTSEKARKAMRRSQRLYRGAA